MPLRPLAPFNVQSLDSVDDALAMLDGNLTDLADMFKDQYIFEAREQWVLDKNLLFLKQFYDRIEILIGEESKE